MLYYLILFQIPTYGAVGYDSLSWTEIRTEMPEEPYAYEYKLLLPNTSKEYLVKYAILHNYDIQGE
jgi:hypothetical protein